MSATTIPHHGLQIGGQEVPGQRGEKATLLNPATNEPLATTALAGREDAKHAVEVALKAFRESGWADADGAHRARVLFRLGQLLTERVDEFSRLETMNQGKPLRESKGDVLFAARTLEYMAGLADKVQGDSIPVPGDRLDYTVREPIGVTVHISPWNYPLQLSVRSMAPALAAGNTVILKPASLTPLTGLAFARLAKEAGLPDGVLNVVVGPGREVGETLVQDPHVASVSFTGSLEVGRRIMELAASHVIPVTLELGGKSPNIVFPDADLDRAAKGVAFGIFMNAGQMCWAGSRLIVHRSIHDAFVGKVAELAKKLRLGPGWESGVEMGPLVSADQRDRVLGYVEKGKSEGAKLVAGGERARSPGTEKGNFVEPTIFTEAAPTMAIAREEIFGPVLTTFGFDTLEEAVGLANDSVYGLFAGVWTKDLSVAHRAARLLHSGMVSVNEYPVTFPQTPFGGYKQSGIGWEQGIHALDFYTRTKNVNVFFGAPKPKK
jgi:aldehyde dehydrogenase (NAD+)